VFVLYSTICVVSQEIWVFILIPSDLQDPVSLITEESYEQCHNPYKNTEIIISFPVTWPIQTQIRSFQACSRKGNFSRKRLDRYVLKNVANTSILQRFTRVRQECCTQCCNASHLPLSFPFISYACGFMGWGEEKQRQIQHVRACWEAPWSPSIETRLFSR